MVYNIGDHYVLNHGSCLLMYILHERIGDYVYLKRPSGREFEYRVSDVRLATSKEIELGHRIDGNNS